MSRIAPTQAQGEEAEEIADAKGPKRRRRRRRPQAQAAEQGNVAGAQDVKKPEEPAETVVLEWSVHLGRGRPVRLAIAIVAILVSSAVAFFFLRNPITPIVMAFVLFAALGDLFFPMHFKITAEGAYRRNFVNSAGIRWKDVRKCYLGPDGIKISPLARRSRLEPFRGVYLHFGKVDREYLIEKVKELRDTAQGEERGAQSAEQGARDRESRG